jgi:hypothetical protein
MKTLTTVAAVAAALAMAAPAQAQASCHREQYHQDTQVSNVIECGIPARLARYGTRAHLTTAVVWFVVEAEYAGRSNSRYHIHLPDQTWTVTRKDSLSTPVEHFTATHRNESVTFTIYQLYQR